MSDRCAADWGGSLIFLQQGTHTVNASNVTPAWDKEVFLMCLFGTQAERSLHLRHSELLLTLVFKHRLGNWAGSELVEPFVI